MRRLRPVTPLLAAVLVLAGCGGGGGGGGGGAAEKTTVAETKTVAVTDAFIFSMTNCLIDANYNVTPRAEEIEGVSEAGVTYLIKFYPSADAAKANVGKKGVLIGNAVVQYNLPGFQQAGGTSSSVKPTTETATIKDCIEKSG